MHACARGDSSQTLTTLIGTNGRPATKVQACSCDCTAGAEGAKQFEGRCSSSTREAFDVGPSVGSAASAGRLPVDRARRLPCSAEAALLPSTPVTASLAQFSKNLSATRGIAYLAVQHVARHTYGMPHIGTFAHSSAKPGGIKENFLDVTRLVN